MLSEIEYEIFNYSGENILIRKFHNNVKVEDIIESWKYLIENDILSNKDKGVINDLCDACLNLTMETFEVLINYLKNNSLLSKIKLAVICNSPDIIVFPMLGNMEHKELHIKPFTTYAAAAEWIING